MADLNGIVIPVDTKQVIDAVNKVKALEGTIEKLFNAFQDGIITQKQFSEGLRNLNKNYVTLGASVSKSTAVIHGYARSLKAAQTEQDKLSVAQKRAETAWALSIQKAEEEEAKAKEAFKAAQNRAETAFALGKQRAEAEAVVTREIIRQRDAIEALTAAEARSFQSNIGKNLGLGAVGISASQSASVFEAEFARQAAEEAKQIEYLKTKYDSLYVAEKLYTSSKRELQQAINLEIGDVTQLQAKLDALEDQYRKIGTTAGFTAEKFIQQSKHMNQAASGAGRFGVVMQQSGYQIGDFIVQVQSGTNAFVAFGQQATQMAGLLLYSMNPAVLAWGVGLSIAIPLLTMIGSIWSRTNKEGKEANEILKEQENRYQALTNKLKEWRLEKQAADIGITPDELVSRETLAEVNKRVTEAQKNLTDLQEAMKASQGTVGGGQAASGMAVAEFAKSLFGMDFQSQLKSAQDALDTAKKDQLDLLAKQAEGVAKVRGELSEQVQLNELISRFGEDSASAELKRLSIEERIFEEKLKSLGVTEEELPAMLELWEKTNGFDKTLAAATKEQTRLQDMVTAGIKVSKDMMGQLSGAASAAKGPFSTLASLAWSIAAGLGEAGKAAPLSPLQLYTKKGELNTNSGGRGIPSSAEPVTYDSSGNVVDFTTKKTNSGGGTSGQTFEEYIKGLEEEVALQEKLVGLHGLSAEIEKGRADAAKALNKSLDQLTPKELERVDSLTKQNYLIEQQRQLVDNAYNSINDALLSVVDGSKSVSSAFRDMMTSILKSIYEQMVTNPIANAGSNLFSTFLSSMSGIPIGSTSANGNVFNAGNLQAFATGGVVGSPTLFPMAGGKTGLMGEAGPEAIMPLKRGPDGRLGVVSSGGGSVTVNNVINVTGTGDAAYVRSEVAKLMPQITGATKAAVIDARKRGGQMASAFR